MTHANNTNRSGKRLLDHQLVQLAISEMNMLNEALRSFVLRVAWEHDQGNRSANGVLMVNYSTDVILRVTKLNMVMESQDLFQFPLLLVTQEITLVIYLCLVHLLECHGVHQM